jgi:dienelactone hydrolase
MENSLMHIDEHNPIDESLDELNKTYKHAYVGVPKGHFALSENFYGTMKSFKKIYKNHADKQLHKLPVVLYMHGSKGLRKGELYMRYIVEEIGALFVAPHSFKIKNRPTYVSPAPAEAYNTVFALRIAELEYALKKLQKLPFVDLENLFLMGNSEGGLVAAIYKSDVFKGRIVTAFSCESSYFFENFALGAKKDEPFLNIIGTEDEYFSKESQFNTHHEVEGHGVIALQSNPYAKVVILAQTGHDITQNIYVKDEITSFLKLWSKPKASLP